MSAGERWFVVGGAGFLGSHFVDRLLGSEEAAGVTVYDNFSSGQEWHLEQHRDDERLVVKRADVGDLDTLTNAMGGHDVVIHLASNPDIARAAVEPTIDFDQGTVLTQNVVEAMRVTETPRILYASGSGVYGDLGETAIDENWGPLLPISTYGASKLAGETLISSYTAMFGLKGRSFRFGNVVGPRQTHGVGFDFVRALLSDPTRLRILGDGSQRKSYIHVLDVVDAVLRADAGPNAYDVYNVATGDEITVTEIADLAVEAVGLSPDAVEYDYAGGDRGWRGDVPVVRLQIGKIEAVGWSCSRSTREALRGSLDALVSESRARQSA
ncbi:MAG: UDP-glucose 4-epimerase [Gaiellaceae bacterium]|jgi:UDP-glucose 4-epimerase|nr:UDP-glucose 4-epimerase [Gaiellaceae bacterium]